MQKLVAVILLFFGEALAIYAELYAANKNISGFDKGLFVKMTLLMAVAGAALIAGYMFGYKSFSNVWIVIALSVGAIVIIEPVIAYLLFRELPTRGAVIGMVLGVAGILSSVLVK
jgi:hypothetical protein